MPKNFTLLFDARYLCDVKFGIASYIIKTVDFI